MIFLKRLYRSLMLAFTSILMLTSCSMIMEDEPDCNPYYKVRFRFDRNMLYADAFSSQIGEVELFVFDTEGKLVWSGQEDGEVLAEEGYMMDLPIAPGTYDMIAWCHKYHENATGFDPEWGEEPSDIKDMKMKLQRSYNGATVESDSDLHALFHGKLSYTLPDSYGTHIVTIPLTKDTNNVRIQLVHLSGKEINKDDFDFLITDNNGYLDYDNSIIQDETITYKSWSKINGLGSMVLPVSGSETGSSITLLEDITRSDVRPIHSLVAEFTISRLQTCNDPKLIITRKSDGEKVVDISLIDYFLLVKGEYHRPMDNDEYLDRQDEYNMTLFMYDDGSWYKTVIDILSWRVVRQSTDL